MIAPVIGISTWNRLSPAHQRALEQAAEDAGETFVKASSELVQQSRTGGMNNYGVTFIEAPLAPWHDKMAPILIEFENDGILPKGLVEQVKAIK